MNALAVVGAGSWGTALAKTLAPRFDRVMLWARDVELAKCINSHRENGRYLPGVRLPANIFATSELGAVLDGAEIVLSVTPARHTRGVYQQMRPHLISGMCFVSATKGIENGTLLRMSEVISEVISPAFQPRVAVLSGPTFAKEVAAGEPTALVIASEDPALASTIQSAFAHSTFRLYTSSDVRGVEYGAALKNVIAIGAGMCQGLGLGGNSVAALVTRGLAEITRLAVALGASPRTLSGLAGLGDLVLTCTGELSRNRAVGIELASGKPLQKILSEMNQVAEGIYTCRAARDLARRFDIQMPITEQMFEILHNEQPVRSAIQQLMERPLTSE